MNRFLTAIMLLLTATAFCGERETIRDAHGKVVGTATRDGNKTVYRDVFPLEKVTLSLIVNVQLSLSSETFQLSASQG